MIEGFAAVWMLKPPPNWRGVSRPRWKVVRRCGSVAEACERLDFWLASYPRPEVLGASMVACVEADVSASALYFWLRNRLKEPCWTGTDIKSSLVRFCRDERGVFSEEL